jgi:GDP-mannose 6-dehydrogenase
MRVAVFGLGYVGCVTGACLAQMGHEVCGVDIAEDKVRMINAGHAPLRERGVERLVARVVRSGKFRATVASAEAMEGAEISLICVGTPSQKDGNANLDYLLRAATDIGTSLRKGKNSHTVVVRSTVPPGTTERVVIPAIERSARQKAGGRINVCFQPEFLREGSSVDDFFHPTRTIIGIHQPRGASQFVKIWQPIKAPLYLTSLRVAEMVKYADNAFHALKVAFANEIGTLAKAAGVDGREVMTIFADDRKLNLSPLYLKPGFAFGGPCLPKDLRALSKMGADNGLATPLLANVLKSNLCHMDRARDLILATGRKRLGILGLVFKSDTDDLRESPACQLVKSLVEAKKQVRVFDPQVNLERLIGANRAYVEHELPQLPSLLADSVEEVLASSEVIVVAGTHAEFATVVRKLSKGQVVIDLVGLVQHSPNPSPLVEGLCW